MELLVCITGNGNAVQPGHVIEAMPDGHAWSEAERSSPAWRIVRVDLTPVEADALRVFGGSAIKLDLTGLPDQMTRVDLYARAGL